MPRWGIMWEWVLMAAYGPCMWRFGVLWDACVRALACAGVGVGAWARAGAYGCAWARGRVRTHPYMRTNPAISIHANS